MSSMLLNNSSSAALYCYNGLFSKMFHRYPINYAVSLNDLVGNLIFLEIAIATCGDLPDPVNGDVELNGILEENTATYTCNEGFSPDGPVVRTCGRNGKWTGAAPMCESELMGGGGGGGGAVGHSMADMAVGFSV